MRRNGLDARFEKWVGDTRSRCTRSTVRVDEGGFAVWSMSAGLKEEVRGEKTGRDKMGCAKPHASVLVNAVRAWLLPEGWRGLGAGVTTGARLCVIEGYGCVSG